MLKRIIRQILPFTIFLGTILIVFHMYQLDGQTVITQETIRYTGDYTWTYYKLDLVKYLQNLQTSIKLNQMSGILPNMPQLPTVDNNSFTEWIKFIASIMLIYITNWIIFIVNVLILVPTKLLLYPLNIVMAIFGINTSNDENIKMFQYLYSIDIPMIQYF